MDFSSLPGQIFIGIAGNLATNLCDVATLGSAFNHASYGSLLLRTTWQPWPSTPASSPSRTPYASLLAPRRRPRPPVPELFPHIEIIPPPESRHHILDLPIAFIIRRYLRICISKPMSIVATIIHTFGPYSTCSIIGLLATAVLS
jgi:hypothetical protein